MDIFQAVTGLAPEGVPIVNPSMLQNKSFKNFN